MKFREKEDNFRLQVRIAEKWDRSEHIKLPCGAGV